MKTIKDKIDERRNWKMTPEQKTQLDHIENEIKVALGEINNLIDFKKHGYKQTLFKKENECYNRGLLQAQKYMNGVFGEFK